MVKNDLWNSVIAKLGFVRGMLKSIESVIAQSVFGSRGCFRYYPVPTCDGKILQHASGNGDFISQTFSFVRVHASKKKIKKIIIFIGFLKNF
jgi:hypothetical protein